MNPKRKRSSLNPAANETSQPVAVPETRKSGEGPLPFGASKEMLVTVAARLLAGAGAVELLAPETEDPEMTDFAECDPHLECNAPWEPSVSAPHREAARGAINLLLACEEVAGEYQAFLCQQRETEARRQRITAMLPEKCSFEEGLRRIVASGKGPKAREREYARFIEGEIAMHRIREPDVTTKKLLHHEKIAGFSRSLLERRIAAFQEWHTSDVAEKRSKAGARGGRKKALDVFPALVGRLLVFCGGGLLFSSVSDGSEPAPFACGKPAFASVNGPILRDRLLIQFSHELRHLEIWRDCKTGMDSHP